MKYWLIFVHDRFHHPYFHKSEFVKIQSTHSMSTFTPYEYENLSRQTSRHGQDVMKVYQQMMTASMKKGKWSNCEGVTQGELKHAGRTS